MVLTRAEAIEQAKVLQALIGLAEVSKILGTFIKAFKNKSVLKSDGIYYLHGSFNLGKVKSGRLSSSGPNLTNLPSGSTYGELIKRCFKAAPGRLFTGADYAALESKINALLTQDEMKLKVFTEGFDSHCLNSFYYFPTEMQDINPESVDSINSIAKKYPKFRKKSKGITFAAQYGATYHSFMDAGFSKEEALQIEKNYQEMYSTSVSWVNSKLIQASKDGFVTCAFGLRLRTPILKQVIFGAAKMPYEASAEGRSAGNAVSGQSHSQLTMRAANEFLSRVYKSKYRLDIKLSCIIHDALYEDIPDNLEVVEWVNKHLIECMAWDKLPELKHDIVKLSAELDVFKEGWHKPITLPNNATQEEIEELLQ